MCNILKLQFMNFCKSFCQQNTHYMHSCRNALHIALYLEFDDIAQFLIESDSEKTTINATDFWGK